MAPAIVVEGLFKRYREVVALDGLDFAVAAGATTALLGANGAAAPSHAGGEVIGGR
jgi:ABC-2 type transport system ATP-binding protein